MSGYLEHARHTRRRLGVQRRAQLHPRQRQPQGISVQGLPACRSDLQRTRHGAVTVGQAAVHDCLQRVGRHRRCDKYSLAESMASGNGSDHTQQHVETFGDDWFDWMLPSPVPTTQKGKCTMSHLARIVSTGTPYAHSIRVGNHVITADEPAALGGRDQGPAPFDLYLASLAACTAITLRMYADKKDWTIGELRADVTLTRDRDGRPHIHRRLWTSSALDDAQWQRLLEIAVNTPVTKAMRDGATITTSRGDGDAPFASANDQEPEHD